MIIFLSRQYIFHVYITTNLTKTSRHEQSQKAHFDIVPRHFQYAEDDIHQRAKLPSEEKAHSSAKRTPIESS